MSGRSRWLHDGSVRYLGVLSLLLILSNLYWIKTDSVIYWDEAGHGKTILQIHDVVLNELLHAKAYSAAIHFYNIVSYVYPPLYYLLAQPVTFLFYNSDYSLRFINTLYYLGIIWLTFYLGSMLYDKKTGLISAFIISTYPIIFGLSRVIMLDLLMVLLLLINVILLLKSDFFQNRIYSILYGASFGMGMLTKTLFITFAVVPLIYTLTQRRIRNPKAFANQAVRANILTSIAIAALLASFWYIPNLPTFLYNSSAVGSHDLLNLGPVYSLKSLLFYPISFINNQASLFYAFILMCAFLLSFRTKHYWFLAFLIIGPIAINMLIQHKVAHQTIGILPFAALLSGRFITAIKKGWLQNSVIAIVIFVGVIQYANVTFGLNLADEKNLLPGTDFPIYLWRNEYYVYSRPPLHEDWRVAEILGDIDAVHGNTTSILVLTKKDYFNWLVFSYLDYKRGQVRIFNGEGIIDNIDSFLNGTYNPNTNDVIILDNSTYEKTKDSVLTGFTPLRYYVLPDGSTSLLLENR
jgi:hypothetical protein